MSYTSYFIEVLHLLVEPIVFDFYAVCDIVLAERPKGFRMSHAILFRITIVIPLSEIERCVLCNAATPFQRNDPIEMRTDYVEGCGQLCHPCAVRVNTT